MNALMRFPELGFYTLPGRVTDSRRLLDEIPRAAALGLGSAWVSERFDVKEAAALCGAAAALAAGMAVATGVTNANTRHPMVTAAFGATMSSLTGGNFCLGLGRGLDTRADAWGLPRTSHAVLADTVGMLRRLWAGETIVDHDGPAGRYPQLALDGPVLLPPTIGLAALGPRAQELGGSLVDVVLLHSHWTDAAVAGCVGRVRRAAEVAGRDPASVQVWSVLVTACELPEEVELRHVVRRLTTYLESPGYGELILAANDWNPSVLERLRSHPVLAGARVDSRDLTLDELRALREVYPQEWITTSCAVGSADECARRVVAQFEAGAAGVVLHASAPDELGPMLDAYSRVRSDDLLVGRGACPGR